MAKFLGETALQELVLKIKNELTSYYTKTQTYSQAEVNSLISAIPKFEIKVVQALPSSNISTSTVYLVTTGAETQNIYTEYIYVNKGTTQNPDWAWEKLGAQSVDLSGYVTTSDLQTALSTALASYYTQTQTNNLLSAKASSTDVANIANNTTKIAGTYGGFSAGAGSSVTSDVENTEGGAIGTSATARTGFAGGASAVTVAGGSVGFGSSSNNGGAVGQQSETTTGGAVGAGAKSTTGFAGGFQAVSTADNAVQLGWGTNNTANTLQFRNIVIVDSNGQLPVALLGLDSTLSSTSQRPVKNSTIYTALSGKQNTLTFDSAPTSASANPVTSGGVFTALSGKQNTLTFDTAPTSASTNPVTSGGVFTALSGKQNTMTEITTAEVDALFD